MSQRFTDAELAAEYWRAMASSQVSINLANRPMATNEDRQRLMRDAAEEASTAGVLLRFATLPHAITWCDCDHKAEQHTWIYCKICRLECRNPNPHGQDTK